MDRAVFTRAPNYFWNYTIIKTEIQGKHNQTSEMETNEMAVWIS